MGLKDKIALMISGVAVLISIAAVIVGEMRSVHEREITIREQLTNVINQIIANSGQLQDLAIRDGRNPDFFQLFLAKQSRVQSLNNFLVQQARYLMDQIPKEVSVSDLLIIAVANEELGNSDESEKFYLRAVKLDTNEFFKTAAMRSLAGFLFRQNRLEEARKVLGQTIGVFKKNSKNRYNRFDTYIFWAQHEAEYGGGKKMALVELENAKRELIEIDSKPQDKHRVEYLENVERNIILMSE